LLNIEFQQTISSDLIIKLKHITAICLVAILKREPIKFCHCIVLIWFVVVWKFVSFRIKDELLLLNHFAYKEKCTEYTGRCRGRDRMVVGFTSWVFEFRSWRGVLDHFESSGEIIACLPLVKTCYQSVNHNTMPLWK
jgi:hypothetical protein